MTTYASRMSGDHADRSVQLQKALGLLEQHQSIDRRCRTCGTASPCRLPAVVAARSTVDIALQLPPQPIISSDPRVRRAAALATRPVVVGEPGREERGSWGDVRGGSRPVNGARAGAPPNGFHSRYATVHGRRRRVEVAELGSITRRKRLALVPGGFSSER